VKNIPAAIFYVLALTAALSCRKPPAPDAKSTTSQPAATSQPATPATPPAAPKPLPAELPDVLARVNGEPVRRADFDRVVRNMELGNGPIPQERRDAVLRGALDQLITYTVMSQEAKAQNVTVADAEIDARIKQMRGRGSESEFKKALDARKMSVEQLRSDARVQLTIEKLMETRVAGAQAASEEEARQFYDKNPDKFKQEVVRASHILLQANAKTQEPASKQARARIDALLKRAKQGEDFATLAREHSQDGSAAQGGDLGYFTRERMVPAFATVAFSLKPGEISDVVTTEFGYHIIKVVDRKPAIPYEQVSAQILEFLTAQKKQQLAGQVVDEAKKRARIEVLV
jgi:peptidyl-prolyl cis-trans isomerase C